MAMMIPKCTVYRQNSSGMYTINSIFIDRSMYVYVRQQSRVLIHCFFTLIIRQRYRQAELCTKSIVAESELQENFWLQQASIAAQILSCNSFAVYIIQPQIERLFYTFNIVCRLLYNSLLFQSKDIFPIRLLTSLVFLWAT